MTRTGVAVELYLFDCLFYEGIDLTGMPLLDRKKVLRDVVWYDGKIQFTPYRTSGSAAMYRDACAKGAEGIIAKRAESIYVSGRSTDWLKIKCVLQQEFVIGGYTAPQGAREHLGALLVGYYDDEGVLRFAGKVGTGYDQDTLEMLRRRLSPLHRRTSPFAPGPVPAGEVQWVTPKLVAQIGFGEWTEAGLLRHPRYLGLREDKTARGSAAGGVDAPERTPPPASRTQSPISPEILPRIAVQLLRSGAPSPPSSAEIPAAWGVERYISRTACLKPSAHAPVTLPS